VVAPKQVNNGVAGEPRARLAPDDDEAAAAERQQHSIISEASWMTNGTDTLAV
jgi:hypothetical protein